MVGRSDGGSGAPQKTMIVEQRPPQDGFSDRIVDRERRHEVIGATLHAPSWTLTERQLCDLELLLNGGFTPLTGFMNQLDYESVCHRMRLQNGTLWPIPIVLDVTQETASTLHPGSLLALRDPEGVVLAVLHVDDLYRPDREAEAALVFGTQSRDHPGVAFLLDRTNPVYVGGTVEGVHLPAHTDFPELRMLPGQVRSAFRKRGWSKVVAFQTRNPMHRVHQELTIRAAAAVGAGLLINPVVGPTKPGDVDHYTRVRCYQALMPRYPADSAMLALLPLAMRMAGPREAVWHAIIRRNFGCTHLIVGRDHAGPGKDRDGRSFYGPYDAQNLLRQFESEIGITMVPFPMLVYVEELDAYLPEAEVPKGFTALSVSGTEVRRRLALGEPLPEWITFPEVVNELRKTYRPRSEQGLTIFFTGLSGAGKSTIVQSLLVKLLERGERTVTVLDGDLVRKLLSSELGFSRAHRDLNIRRIGFVASEITRHGGIAICAPIAPYDAARREVRSMIEPHGGFLLVHVATALEVCEARDRKGLYARARAGIVKDFTGISDPYEVPTDAELTIDTAAVEPDQAATLIVRYLEQHGYLGPRGAAA
jgi:sulfate adenylyltransferase